AFCANCDGPLFKDQVVAVIGGGFSALREVSLLDKFAKKILIVNEQDQLKANKLFTNYAKNPKVQVYNQTELVSITGDGQKVTGITVRNKKTNQVNALPVDGVFIALGQTPNSAVFKTQLHLNAKGEVVVDGQTLATNVPGIFAAGDVTDKAGHQILLANAAGYQAAMQAENYLKKLKIIT
ncbi:MAG TPA: FAD-dependent oxidoreductase, partial [Candidatus Babeliales bacterium]|nr:FAD-dependent oxidoreductase [Candidatus Babeliales bacterium]